MDYQLILFCLLFIIVNSYYSLMNKFLYLIINWNSLAHYLSEDLVYPICIGSLFSSRNHWLGLRNW